MRDKYTFRLQRQPHLGVGDDIQVYLTWAQPNQPLKLCRWDAWEEIQSSTPIGYLDHITITNETAQTLMDDLWACGIRPSEGAGSAGQLAAVQNNLADLRTSNDRYFELIRRLVDIAGHPLIASTLEVRDAK